MAVKWKVKNEEKKESHPAQGVTDYDIPMIGYRSAFFILMTAFTSIFLVPELMKLFFNDFRWGTVLVSSLIIGFSISFSNYYIERKKKADRWFYVLGGLWSLAVGVVLFLFYYAKMLF